MLTAPQILIECDFVAARSARESQVLNRNVWSKNGQRAPGLPNLVQKRGRFAAGKVWRTFCDLHKLSPVRLRPDKWLSGFTHHLRSRVPDASLGDQISKRIAPVSEGMPPYAKFVSSLRLFYFLSPSVRSRLYAALISARCVNACGKLPSASPWIPVSSEYRPRWFAYVSIFSNASRASSRR